MNNNLTPKIAMAALCLSLNVTLISCGGSATNNQASSGSSTNSAPASSIGVGQVLKTDYFDVTVNKVSITQKIKDPSGLEMHVTAEPGTKLLVLNVTFKNNDSESRMAMDGSVHFNYGGKDYNFDNSETLMIDGYGLFLDQLNPLISKTTNLVYKIPAEVSGEAYYNPGRADGDERIILGNIQ
jgi:hypothetical protein